MRPAHLAAALAMLVLSSCGSSPIGQPAQTSGTDVNVTGTLDRGPIPTCPADEPCDPPARAFSPIFSRTGAADVIVRVAPDGSFRPPPRAG